MILSRSTVTTNAQMRAFEAAVVCFDYAGRRAANKKAVANDTF